MNYFLAVTLGNTSATLAAVRKGELEKVRRVPLDRLEALRPDLAKARPTNGGRAVPIAAASVNPPALERLRRLAAEAAPEAPVRVARDDFPIPIRTSVDEPARVGADRLLGALAAYRRLHVACIVVDMGTAITVNSVDAHGVFLGGAIFPGLAMMAAALAEGTALLPQVRPVAAPAAVGRSTEAAIVAGIISGAAGAVSNLVCAARKVVGSGAHVVLTGGDARRVAGFLPHECRDIRPNLVLEGLVIAYREWKKR